MQIQIHARNFSVNQRLQDYVEKKVNKLDKFLPHIDDVHIELANEKLHKGGERFIAQLTVRDRRGMILRAEEKRQADIYAAVDITVDKMYRLISRYKGKRRRHAGESFDTLEPEFAAAESVPLEEEEDETEEIPQIVRRKKLELVPMSEEEAIDQMELLGHDFFVFYNAQNGRVNVLYRREGGGFGLLEPAGA